MLPTIHGCPVKNHSSQKTENLSSDIRMAISVLPDLSKPVNFTDLGNSIVKTAHS
jgi:hypothetical protein